MCHADIVQMSTTEEYLIESADRLARTVRELRELADRLSQVGDDLLAKAIELDTIRDRSTRA